LHMGREVARQDSAAHVQPWGPGEVPLPSETSRTPDPDPPRPQDGLPPERRGALDPPRPRHHERLAELAAGHPAPGPRARRDRPGPTGPRKLVPAARGSLPRRPCVHAARPRPGDRPRPRHGGWTLARRRGGDAVRLPVPRDGGAARARLLRRPRPRGQPAHPQRRAARRGAGAAAAHLPAADRHRNEGRGRPRARSRAAWRRSGTPSAARRSCGPSARWSPPLASA
jgi:hypothetical protein